MTPPTPPNRRGGTMGEKPEQKETWAVRMKNVTCHVNKQRMLQSSSQWPLPTLSPAGTQDRNDGMGHWASKVKVRFKRTISMSPNSSHTEESAETLNWFSLINSNLLMLWITEFCGKAPIHPVSSLSSSEQTLWAIWEAACWAWVLSKSTK